MLSRKSNAAPHGLVPGAGRAVWAATALLCITLAATGQQQETKDVAGPPKESVKVSAVSLKLGTELRESASADLKKWAAKHAGEDPGKTRTAADEMMKAVESDFAAFSPQIRDTVIYLVFYLAYESSSTTHTANAQRRQEIEREITKLREQLRIWETVFTHPPPGSPAASQREVEIRETNQRLDQLSGHRQAALRAEAEYLQRTNGYLALLDHGYKMLGTVSPKILAGVRPRAGLE